MAAVFVYGTLKRGFPNYGPAGMERFPCLGRFRTREAYPLIIGGRWFSPILIDEPGLGHQVLGELYEVDDAGLVVLDKLESTHLPDGYRRVRRDMEPEAGGESVSAWVYVKARGAVAAVHSEMMAEYSLDPLLRRYVPPAERK